MKLLNTSINNFSGDYRWLSNFYVSDVEYEGIIFPSSENAYQWSKDRTRVDLFRTCTPGKSKRLGAASEIDVKDWNLKRDSIMYNIVESKFSQNKILQEKLLATGELELIEGNTWGDRYWGQCPVGEGKNKLGVILMTLRNSFRYEIR